MRFDFTDKRVLVTGGTRGIGRATVAAFLESGARVAVNGRTAKSTDAGIAALDGGERLLAALGGGDRLVAAPGNVATAEGCKGIVEAAVTTLGGLDILVNSAGVGTEATIEETDEAAWNAMLDVNLKGPFFCIRAALPALRDSGGNVVNVASDAGLMGALPGMAAYCASKGGLVNLTRAMALELAPAVRVNSVCPGNVDTDMLRLDPDGSPVSAAEMAELRDYAPMGRIATPAEIAAAILYLASDHARFVTGSALQIDGGSTAGY